MKHTKTCLTCNKTFETDVDSGNPEIDAMVLRWAKHCPPCSELKRLEAERNRKSDEEMARIREWERICPPLFLDTDDNLLPMPEKHKEGMDWEYGASGLLLFGKTRTGKSRCAWKICEKYFLKGKWVIVMDSRAGFEYGSIFSTGGDAVLEWVDSRSKCSILFLDDVFKVKLTDSFEAALFAIVDYRLNHKLPIIATLNDTGATLSARMTEDRGSAFVARLKESATTISFA
jgi:hypothetical protein